MLVRRHIRWNPYSYYALICNIIQNQNTRDRILFVQINLCSNYWLNALNSDIGLLSMQTILFTWLLWGTAPCNRFCHICINERALGLKEVIFAAVKWQFVFIRNGSSNSMQQYATYKTTYNTGLGRGGKAQAPQNFSYWKAETSQVATCNNPQMTCNMFSLHFLKLYCQDSKL